MKTGQDSTKEARLFQKAGLLSQHRRRCQRRAIFTRAPSVKLFSGAMMTNSPSLIPLVISQVTFPQIYIRSGETRYSDWPSFVEWVKAQGGKATIANVSKEGSMERVTMKFITPVKIEKSAININHANAITLVGSCFAESIGNKLTYHGFNVHQNPFGIIYNPISLASMLSRVIDKQYYKEHTQVIPVNYKLATI